MRESARRAAEEAEGEQAEGEQAETGERPGEARAQGEQASRTRDSSDGVPRFRQGDVRQFRREFRERREEAESLRDELAQQGIESAELNDVIDRLSQLERERAWGDIRGLERLQAQVIVGLKEFEYALRRALGAEDDRELLLTGSDEVPPGYRELVEQYYRSLAEQRRN